jgi:hypothetical protein
VVVALENSRIISKHLADRAGPVVLVLLVIGGGLYFIGVAAAAVIDPSGFFSIRMKPWAQNGPAWARALFAASLAGSLIAVAHYRLSPGAGSALWIGLAGAITIVSAWVVRRRAA